MIPDRWEKDGFVLSTDRRLLDTDWVHKSLSSSYWAEGIPKETVEKSIAGSLCFGMQTPDGKQMAIARVISDYATFAYLCDVYMEEQYRGRGLAIWMLETIIHHPELQGLRRFALVTTYAADFYARFGFAPLTHPGRWMERLNTEVYTT